MSPADESPQSRPSPRLRIRPPVRPWRIVVGGGLVVASAIACWALIADASERHQVLILRAEIQAGEAVAIEDLGVVAIGTDDDIASIDADRIGDYVGQYARYRLAAGALLTPDDLQARPLVAPGRVLVAIEVAAGDVPREIAPGDDVTLVVGGVGACDGTPSVSVLDATVTFIPARDAGSTEVSVSVEIDAAAMSTVATAERVVIARSGSPEVAAAVAAADAPDPCAEADVPPSADADSAGSAVTEVPAPPSLPVPTGVTPLDPAEVLVEPST